MNSMITEKFQELSVDGSRKTGLRSLTKRMEQLLREGCTIQENDAEQEFLRCWEEMIEKMKKQHLVNSNCKVLLIVSHLGGPRFQIHFFPLV